MKRLLVVAFLAFAFSLCLGRAQAAPVEFCPAQVSDFAALPGNAYAFQLSAGSTRSVTGKLSIETDAGWFVAPFKPVQLIQKNVALPAQSQPLYVAFPQPLHVLNAWLGLAASDQPDWAPRGVVACAPHARPLLAREHPLPPPAEPSAMITAVKSAPLASTDCSTPFADAKPLDDALPLGADGASSVSANVRVDIDGHGKPVDATVLQVFPASAVEFGQQLAQRVEAMQFQPAIAYCKPVPSTYIFRQTAGN